ncbi:MAG: hypothetical protein CMB80_28270 [Flammeovirgaceae bacterium]|nr:hypothetical protein [Flammeovirgaceae bacterium]
MKVLVSDEIADSIDVTQFGEFYEDSFEDSIILSLSAGSKTINGQLSQMGILGADMIKIDFICNSSDAVSFILDDISEEISLFLSKDDLPIKKYVEFDVVTKSIKLMKDRRYECDLIVKLTNT